MVEDGEEKKKKKRRISSFNGYLSHSSSRVEFELGLGLRLTKNGNQGLRSARFLKVCQYDQLRRNSCYDELGCNNLVVIALLLRPA